MKFINKSLMYFIENIFLFIIIYKSNLIIKCFIIIVNK